MKEDGRKEQSIAAGAKMSVADTINYDIDVAPHRCIGLWACVGSGKNYFAESFITGNKKYGIPRLTVMIITSRKSKVIETLSEFKDEEKLNCRLTNAATEYYFIDKYGYVPDECWKTVLAEDGHTYGILQRSVACTNAYIEGYHRHVYDPSNPETHLWNRFDIIIWDEVHSLITDSSYQSSPFHVARLFDETFRRMENRGTENDEYFPADCISPRCEKLIMMSGTPEAIAGVEIVPELHELDLRTKCINVVPRNIYFLDTALAEQKIRRQLADGKRIVYFTNHIVQPDDVSRKYNIPAEKLAVSFSEGDRRKKLKETDEDAFDRMEKVEKYLAANQSIHPDIQLFFTTSRNKEGINIKDKDINEVYVEALSMTDIKQMAGRVRHGTENLYIIMDAKGYGDNENRWECDYAKHEALEHVKKGYSLLNLNLKKHCRSLGADDMVFNEHYRLNDENSKNRQIISYIDLLKAKSPYFEYDYISNSFCFNSYREKSRLYYELEKEAFEEAYCRGDLVSMFRNGFPGAVVHEPEFCEDRVDEIVDEMKAKYAVGELTKADVEAYAVELDMLLSDYRTRSRRTSNKLQINRILRLVGLSYDRKSNHKGSPNYEVWELKTLDVDIEDDIAV